MTSREDLAARGYLIVKSRAAALRKNPAQPSASAAPDSFSRQVETRVADPAATAAAIIAAGKKARGETDSAPASSRGAKPLTLADQIVAASRKRRGED